MKLNGAYLFIAIKLFYGGWILRRIVLRFFYFGKAYVREFEVFEVFEDILSEEEKLSAFFVYG